MLTFSEHSRTALRDFNIVATLLYVFQQHIAKRLSSVLVRYSMVQVSSRWRKGAPHSLHDVTCSIDDPSVPEHVMHPFPTAFATFRYALFVLMRKSLIPVDS